MAAHSSPRGAGLRNLREAAVIVFSVILALAADSWWDGRGERAQEAIYLERLATELDSLGVAIETASRRDSASLAETRAFLRMLHGGPSDSIGFSVPLSYSIFDPATGTLRVLTTSDQSRLIRSEDVRAAMQAVEGALARTEVLLNRTESEVWALAQRYFILVEGLWDANGRRPESGPLLTTYEDFSLRLPQSLLRASPELRGIFLQQEMVLQNRLFYLRGLRSRVARLQEILPDA